MRAVLNDDNHFSKTVLRETDILIKSFLNSEKSRFDPTYLLKFLACSLQFRLFFGERLRDTFVKKAKFMIDGSTDFIESSAVGNSVDFMPWMQATFKKQVQRLDESVTELTEFVKKLYYVIKRDSKVSDTEETTFNKALEQVVKDKEALKFGSEHLEEDADDDNSNHFDDERLINS